MGELQKMVSVMSVMIQDLVFVMEKQLQWRNVLTLAILCPNLDHFLLPATKESQLERYKQELAPFL